MPTDPRRFGVLVLFALAAGCGQGEKLYNVSGTVKFEGKPVPAGNIFFDPDPTRGGTGPQGIASILNGKYTTAVDGCGIRGGSYNVRILGYDGKSANEAPLGQALFREHEEKRDLPAADSEMNFDIPKRSRGK